MTSEKRPAEHSVEAILDRDLEGILRGMGIYDELLAGNRSCAECSRLITLDNLGGFRALGDNAYELICDFPECLSAALDRDQR